MVETASNSQGVGLGGWAVALSTRGIGQGIILGLMALSVFSGVLAAPRPSDGAPIAAAQVLERREKVGFGAAMNRDEAEAVWMAIARSQGERPESSADILSPDLLQARLHDHAGAAPLKRTHRRLNKGLSARVTTADKDEESSKKVSGSSDDDKDDIKTVTKTSTKTNKTTKDSSKAIATKTTTTTMTKSSTNASATSSTRSSTQAVVFKVQASSTISSVSSLFASATSEAATSSSTSESSGAESVDSTGYTVNTATVANGSTSLSPLNPQSKLFPAAITIIVCGTLALLFLFFLGIRGYRWRKQEKTQESHKTQLSGAGAQGRFAKFASRAGSSRMKGGARTLRKALSSEKLDNDCHEQANSGSVLLEVGNEIVSVPADVAEEYLAAKRIYGASSGMWNGRLYLSQCLARHGCNEMLRRSGPYTPSPLGNVTAWNRSNSTLVSDGYLDEEKRKEEKRGLSARLLENLRAMRGANPADETDESIDPEKTGSQNATGLILTRGEQQQWAITPSRISSQQEAVEEPARRSSELSHAHYAPQPMPSPIVFDTFNDSPKPHSLSVATRQEGEIRGTSIGSPRLVPLPASPMPELHERYMSPQSLPKVTLEDKPSSEARNRIVSRRRHRTSRVQSMLASSADAYQDLDASSPMYMGAQRARAASCAVMSEPGPTNHHRGHRTASVPVQHPEVGRQVASQIPLVVPVPAPVALSPLTAGSAIAEEEEEDSTSRRLSSTAAAPRTEPAVSSRMSPVSSRDRLQSARANLQQERQRGVSYSGGPAAVRTAERPNRYISGPAAPSRNGVPVWTRHQSLT